MLVLKNSKRYFDKQESALRAEIMSFKKDYFPQTTSFFSIIVTDLCPDSDTDAEIFFQKANSELFDYIEGDATIFEKEPMEYLLHKEALMAYTHKGYWQCMDTMREKQQLESLWESGKAPWKKWND